MEQRVEHRGGLAGCSVPVGGGGGRCERTVTQGDVFPSDSLLIHPVFKGDAPTLPLSSPTLPLPLPRSLSLHIQRGCGLRSTL
ncbi:unnamed protein product [Arctogadus glacialis]